MKGKRKDVDKDHRLNVRCDGHFIFKFHISHATEKGTCSQRLLHFHALDSTGIDMSTEKSLSAGAKKCRIAEIVQFTCQTENQPNGQVQNHCFPIPRIFRMSETVHIRKDTNAHSSLIVAQNDPLSKSRNWSALTNEQEK